VETLLLQSKRSIFGEEMTVYCMHCKILYCTNGFDGSFAVSPQSKDTKKKCRRKKRLTYLECHN